METWLLWKLTEGASHFTDITNASRTLLFNLHTKTWDDELLKPLNIPRAMLPEVRSNSEVFGTVSGHLQAASGLAITGMAGDQHAALFGQACFAPGEAKNTYGTGCFLLMNMGEKIVASRNGLLSTIAYELNGKAFYALEGSVFVAGSAIQWLRDGLQFFTSASESEALASEVSDSGGVFVVPAFVGLGAPYWDPDVRGSIFGLTRGTKKAHLVRATLESLAFQTHAVVSAMEADAGIKLAYLSVDGGAVKNDLLMQFQSDLLGVPVRRPKVQETTAFGAAAFAGLAIGFWKDTNDFKKDLAIEKIFSPSADRAPFEKKIRNWKKAVEAARLFKPE
jgi:glycerol kinase